MLAKTRKLALIYTGGTLGMEQKAGKLVASNLDANLALPDSWLVEKNISVTYIEKPPIDSSIMGVDFYIKLASILRELEQDYSAFVILQGTDTMEFSASATAFFCRDIKKTIVFTGAQLPIFYPNSDAKSNIQNAITWSLFPEISGVNISFGDYLIKAVNSYKLSSKKLNAFVNFSTGIVGELKSKKETNEKTSSEKDFVLYKNTNEATNLMNFANSSDPSASQISEILAQNISQTLDIFCSRIAKNKDFEIPKIARVTVFPSLDEQSLINYCNEADIIFIEAYASGTMPFVKNFLEFLSAKIKASAKVILLSQSLDSGIYQAQYSTNLQANLDGVFSAENMTFATAYAKSLFLWFSEIKDTEKWRELWSEDFVGEFKTFSQKLSV